MLNFRKKRGAAFEESLGDDWTQALGLTERPLDSKVLFFLGLVVLAVGILVIGRMIFIASSHSFYEARAEANLSEVQKVSAPRGIITDSRGEVLAENRPSFLAVLSAKDFYKNGSLQSETLKVAEEVLGMSEDNFWSLLNGNDQNFFRDEIILNNDLNQSQLIKLESLKLPTLLVERGFKRQYTDGPVFSPVIGYTGLASLSDLKHYPELGSGDFIGKTGIEAFYEDKLRGKPGISVKVRNALGNILEEKGGQEPEIGQELKLTIDAGFQKYFYDRLRQGLSDLGRSVAVGLAIDPRDGKILALVNLPSFDNNIFNSPLKSKEIKDLLTSPLKPLFNRAVGGVYSPGSAIKPLHAVAALEEGVITPEKEIFSPGYLDVPNPYNPDQPTRFLDWRYQGNVNLASAIAQSSNVYFYLVGGGSPNQAMAGQGGITGLGINRLHDWWTKFGLGKALGVDLPGEAAGSLPDIATKEAETGKPWLLGDTYHVSIGQGDLLVTPLQLLSYIGAIANGGKVYRPYLADSMERPMVISDLSSTISSIKEVQKGMIKTVEFSKGTAYALHDLPFSVAAKTGSAQVKDNAEENAFFVGYAPAYAEATAGRPASNPNKNTTEEPKVSVLILVENAKQGSLNAVPIAKDVLDWYYVNRISKK